jgi:putative FmdB family regulatory protein
MPLYDFLCRDCDHAYEDLVSSSDAVADQTCPRCRSGEVVKQYSSFALGAGVRSSSTSAGDLAMAQMGGGGACLPGPASSGGGRSGGCCGGGCGGCG